MKKRIPKPSNPCERIFKIPHDKFWEIEDDTDEYWDLCSDLDNGSLEEESLPDHEEYRYIWSIKGKEWVYVSNK